MKNSVARLDHINFTVSHFQESIDWYKNIFNFCLVEEGANKKGRRWGILKSGDSMLAISEFPEKKLDISGEHHKMYHFALRLIDEKEWVGTLEMFNMETYYSSPIHYLYSKSWYVKDPTGNEIEVVIWNDDRVTFPITN